MPKISFVLPVYNVEKYLHDCLESLINQTMPDLEFIFVDDGSTDNSLNIIKKYADKDARFIILSQPNQGAGAARNEALKIARGEYVMCLDPDDWLELNASEILYKKLKETDAVVLLFDWKNRYEAGGSKQTVSNESHADLVINLGGNDIGKKGYFDWVTYKKYFFILSGGTWGRIYSNKFLKDNNIRFSEILIGEDRLFGVMSLLCAEKIYYINEYLYNYRIRPDSLTRKQSDKYFNNPFICYSEIKAFLQNKGCFEELIEEFNENKISFFKMIYFLLPPNRRKEYKKLCRKEFSYSQYCEIFRARQSFIKNIFSIENVGRYSCDKYKQITIMGFSFEIKKKINKV